MADYKPDYKGSAELMRSPQMLGAMELFAHEGMAIAKAISPDAPVHGEGYIASFEVSVGVGTIRTRRGPSRRAIAELANTSDHALVVEVGVPGRQEGHHVLGRTADVLRTTDG